MSELLNNHNNGYCKYALITQPNKLCYEDEFNNQSIEHFNENRYRKLKSVNNNYNNSIKTINTTEYPNFIFYYNNYYFPVYKIKGYTFLSEKNITIQCFEPLYRSNLPICSVFITPFGISTDSNLSSLLRNNSISLGDNISIDFLLSYTSHIEFAGNIISKSDPTYNNITYNIDDLFTSNNILISLDSRYFTNTNLDSFNDVIKSNFNLSKSSNFKKNINNKIMPNDMIL